jgi:hypothetical protein
MYRRCHAIDEYTTTVSEQRLGKHVPAAVVQQQRSGVFYVVRAEYCNRKGLGQLVSCKSAQLKV